ncbi:MAG: GGDEF domain-containing protein, partial [Trueperaceae bacterium]|nr:GGDEF domain-containing protein [Trueperaceae bacterium]
VLVFAPGVDNAGMIARRLREAGVACLVCADVEVFEAVLVEQSERLGAVVVTALGVRRGAGAAIARFKSDEPAWSALPVVLLAPPGAAVVPPWGHTTLVTQPTTSHQLTDVVTRAVEARSHQHLLANRSHELHRVAFQDALTGLPNRSALYEKIRELQLERRGAVGTFAALFIDLDGFKAINDVHGHLVGDEALRQVAAHLVAAVRATDYVGRWGGDEFMVLLVGPSDTERVAETVRRLGQGVDLRLQTTSEPVRAAFSVGLIDDIAPEATPDEILSHADERMYEHKRRQRSTDPG